MRCAHDRRNMPLCHVYWPVAWKRRMQVAMRCVANAYSEVVLRGRGSLVSLGRSGVVTGHPREAVQACEVGI